MSASASNSTTFFTPATQYYVDDDNVNVFAPVKAAKGKSRISPYSKTHVRRQLFPVHQPMPRSVSVTK